MQNIVFAQKTARELERDISERSAELRKLEQEAERIKQEISKTGSEKATLSRELALINKERFSLENTIKQTRSKISLLGSQISKNKNQIEKQRNKIKRQTDTIAHTLRKINQAETSSLWENLLETKKISEVFLLRDQYLLIQPTIIKYINSLRKERESLNKNIQSLSQKQDTLEKEKEKLDDQNAIVKEQVGKKQSVLQATKNKESLYQKNLRKTLASIKALDQEIRDFESKLKFILNKKALPGKGSAPFAWPLEKVLITQRFGKTTASGRLYKSGSHSGMDFRAAVGTPVYAVADGVVKGTGNTDATCPRASFGKWVFIEHSNGLSTTSGHLSRIKATQGQRIKKGDIIGYSGNTGRSTAPHLHLTVYATKGINGESGVRITNRPSAACSGKSYRMPLAPTAAYLDPLDYLPSASTNMFKHPSLAGR